MSPQNTRLGQERGAATAAEMHVRQQESAAWILAELSPVELAALISALRRLLTRVRAAPPTNPWVVAAIGALAVNANVTDTETGPRAISSTGA